jgi:hypothetical protein
MEDMMADRVSASITLGGTLSTDQYEALAQIIASEGLSTEWDGEPFEPHHRIEGQSLSLFAHEVAGGTFEQLESWCVDHGLPFARWCGGYPGAWGPERLVFTGEGEPISHACDEEDHIVMPRQTVEKLASFEAVIAYFDGADFKVPPLVISDDAPTASNDEGAGP